MSDTEKELQFHIEMQTRRYIDAGLDPVAARAKALERMGDLDAATKAVHEIHVLSQTPPANRSKWMNGLGQDLRHAFRVLRRSPGYVAIAVSMLALGTGASTAVFSVVDGVLLRSPFPDADAIGLVRARDADGRLTSAVPTDTFARLEAGLPPSIVAIGRLTVSSLVVTGVTVPRRTQVECISAPMAAVMGTAPVRGRWFSIVDDRPGAPPVAVVSDKFWRGTLQSDPTVIGRTINLDSAPVTIVGVMPRGFDGPLSRLNRDIWIPLGLSTPHVPAFGCRVDGAVATGAVRLATGVTMAEGAAALNASAGLDSLELASIAEDTVGDLRSPFNALVGAVIAVLLIAFANVTNLGLERMAGRRQELSIRAALGSTRARILRQSVLEHLMVATSGALGGVVIATAGFDAIVALLPDSLPHVDAVNLNVRVLAASLGLTILGGAVAGLVSAWTASRATAVEGLVASSRAHTGRRTWTRKLLVASELALGVLLLVGALLMIRTFLTLRPSAPGFDASNKYLAMVRQPTSVAGADRLRFFETVRDEVQRIPGVRAVAATSYLPLYRSIDVRPMTVGSQKGDVYTGAITPNYLSVMRIPLLRGRDFTSADNSDVAIVNRAFVERWLPQQEALGTVVTLATGRAEAPVTATIVGIAENTRAFGSDTRSRPVVYRPLRPSTIANPFLVIEADEKTSVTLADSVRSVVDRARPGQLIDRFERFETMLGAEVSRPRLGAWLFGSFAVLAVLLAGVGLAVTLVWSVAQRRREIGVRMALGAKPSDVRRLIVGQMLGLSLTGVAAGLAAAAATTHLLKGWLYGVTPLDPLTFAACGAVMLAVSALAAYLPARRATRISPLIALRGD